MSDGFKLNKGPTLTLHFKDEAQRDFFLAQMLDGWGEGGPFHFDWNWRPAHKRGDERGMGASNFDRFNCEVSEYWCEENGIEFPRDEG